MEHVLLYNEEVIEAEDKYQNEPASIGKQSQ